MNTYDSDISARSITLVDLDGTLVMGNTWKFFARLMLRTALRRGRLHSIISLGTLLFLRKLKLISHARVKKSFMLRSHNLLTPNDLNAFAEDIAGRFNPEVIEILRDVRANDSLIVLATAAAGEYVPYIAEKAGIREILATPPAVKGEPYLECRGKRKADEAQHLANRLQLPVTFILTDHPYSASICPDLPLIKRFPKAAYEIITPKD